MSGSPKPSDEPVDVPATPSVDADVGSFETCPHLHPDRAWGQVGHLTEKMTEQLQEMRAEVAQEELDAIKFPHESNDQVCLRFLRGRNFKVADALQVLRKAIAWRRSFGMDRYKYMTTEQVGEQQRRTKRIHCLRSAHTASRTHTV
jgi:hypothetical protein